jgi:D-alanyl-lipoteichoic acid acyltransferase DltB (MBOAT superfamily)
MAPKIALWWAMVCSVFFYGFHGWEHIPLLLGSIALNYGLGLAIEKRKGTPTSSRLLALGVTVNLIFLAIFKYADFLLSNLASFTDSAATTSGIALPLAISFFTFQQIAYLVDLRKEKISTPTFGSYCLFVTFFPQLIAGPIVRCQRIMPQIVKGTLGQFSRETLWAGLCLFSLGLFKKTCLADGIRPLADEVFAAAQDGTILSLAEAWTGATAFGLQIYFDFSAYSEMALGLGLLFGLRLPLNFNSPYKATNIIDFWRCWHITLSEFLRDYLYKPLGGNRSGMTRGIVNIFIVMALGGLWHGAAWTFVAWGIMHGILIGSNHLLRAWRGMPNQGKPDSLAKTWLFRLMTFACVTLAWVFFRSQEFGQAFEMLESMLGLNGIDLPRSFGNLEQGAFLRSGGLLPHQVADITLLPLLPVLLGIVWFTPNAMQLLKIDCDENISVPLPSAKITFLCGILLFFGLKVSFETITHDFLYFRF